MHVADTFYWSEKTREAKAKETEVAKSGEARAAKAPSYDFEASSSHKDFISWCWRGGKVFNLIFI